MDLYPLHQRSKWGKVMLACAPEQTVRLNQCLLHKKGPNPREKNATYELLRGHGGG